MSLTGALSRAPLAPSFQNLDGGFSPANFPNLKAWYAADRLTGLVDGAAVATWPDSSGQGRDAAQVDVAKQPLYKINVINGYPTVRFDGVNDFLLTAAFSPSIAQPFTVYVVGQAPGANQTFIDGIGTRTQLIRNAAGNALMYAGTAGIADGAMTAGTFYVICAVYSGASSSIVLNNGTPTTGNPGTAACGGLHIGSDNNGTGNLFAGDDAEILLYGAAHDAALQATISRALGAKYGLVVA